MVRLVLLIIVALAVLSYFGVSVRGVVESDMFRENFAYAWNWTEYLWENHLAGPARYLWYDVFLKVVWSAFLENMERIKAGKDTQIMEYAPSVNFGD